MSKELTRSEFLLYQTEDGQTRVEVRFAGETVWLTQAQMAELFQTTKQNVSLHIQNVFDEGELDRRATVKDYLTVQKEGVARGLTKPRLLQPQRHYFRRLPGQIAPRNTVPHLGDPAVLRVSRQGLYAG